MSTTVNPVAESTPSSLFLLDPRTPATSAFFQTPATSAFSQTPAASVYSPTDVDDPLPECKPLEKPNSFLELKAGHKSCKTSYEHSMGRG